MMNEWAISRRTAWLAAATVVAVAAAALLGFYLTDAEATHQRAEARAAGDAIKDLQNDEVAAAFRAVDQASETIDDVAAETFDLTAAFPVADGVIDPAIATITRTGAGTSASAVDTLVDDLVTSHAEARAAEARRLTKARGIQSTVRSHANAAEDAALAAQEAVQAAVDGTGHLALLTPARDALANLVTAAGNTYTMAKDTQTKVEDLDNAVSAVENSLSTALTRARTLQSRLGSLQAAITAAADSTPVDDTPDELRRILDARISAETARADLASAITTAKDAWTAAHTGVANIKTAAGDPAGTDGARGSVGATNVEPAEAACTAAALDTGTLRDALACAIYRYDNDALVKAAIENTHPTEPAQPPPPDPVEVEVQVEVETPLPGAPSSATLTSPTRGASGGARPVFTWSVPSGSESYRLYVATDQAFTRESIVEVGILAANERSWAPARSLPAGTYWWRIETRTPFRERFYQLTMSSPASFTVRAAVSVADVSVQFQRQTAKRTALITATVDVNVEGATVTVRVKNAQGRTIYTAPSRTLADGERTVTVAWSSVKRQGGRTFTAEVTVQSGGQADTGQATFRTPPK